MVLGGSRASKYRACQQNQVFSEHAADLPETKFGTPARSPPSTCAGGEDDVSYRSEGDPNGISNPWARWDGEWGGVGEFLAAATFPLVVLCRFSVLSRFLFWRVGGGGDDRYCCSTVESAEREGGGGA